MPAAGVSSASLIQGTTPCADFLLLRALYRSQLSPSRHRPALPTVTGFAPATASRVGRPTPPRWTRPVGNTTAPPARPTRTAASARKADQLKCSAVGAAADGPPPSAAR